MVALPAPHAIHVSSGENAILSEGSCVRAVNYGTDFLNDLASHIRMAESLEPGVSHQARKPDEM